MDDEQAPTAELPNHDQETQPSEPVAPTEQILPAAESPRVETEPTSLHGLASAAGSFAREHAARLKGLLSGRTLNLIIAAAAIVAAIAGIGIIVRNLTDLPDASKYRRDAQATLAAPTYDGGTYGSDEPLSLTDFEATGQHKEAKTPNECLVNGIAHFSNGSVEALQEAQLTYVRQDDGWKCASADGVGGASYAAVTGPEPSKILSNLNSVLQRAEASYAGEESGTALPSLYAGAKAEMVEESFDAESQTYTCDLHLSHTATFTAYECDINATFVFRPSNGLWELTAASASKNAKDLTLTPLVGNWVGSFSEQEASGSKCFGAKANGLRINVTMAANGRIAGTLSATVHYHGEPSEDVNESEGDTELVDVPFSGTLLHQGDGITFSCHTPEDALGTVTLTLAFGTGEDPSAAIATLSTKHIYDATFLLFVYDREATFTDTFVLTRE